MKDTVSSMEATEAEKALVQAFNPLPLSNEEAWAIARKHLNAMEQSYEEDAHLLRLANAALESRVKRVIGVVESEIAAGATVLSLDDMAVIVAILKGE